MPLLLLQPDDSNRHAFADELLRAEGLFTFERAGLVDVDAARLQATAAVVALSGHYDDTAADRLRQWTAAGGTLLVLGPAAALVSALGLTAGDTITTAWVVMGAETALAVPADEDLPCPGRISQRLSGNGEALLKLRSALNDDLGPAVLHVAVGSGQAICFAYNPVDAVINLRHGLDDFDPKPATVDLRGPRHLHALIGIADQYSQRAPVCDLHMDLLRELLLSHLPPRPLPRLWHFPAAAPSLYFL
jgi:hypothetical protein